MATTKGLIRSNVAALKAMLPAASYMHLLHQGVMTGFLPRFDPLGKPTGQFDNLSPGDRVAMARYLLDKVVPDAPKELALVPSQPSEEELKNPVTIAHLSSEELRRIATLQIDEKAPDVNTEILSSGDLVIPSETRVGTPGISPS